MCDHKQVSVSLQAFLFILGLTIDPYLCVVMCLSTSHTQSIVGTQIVERLFSLFTACGVEQRIRTCGGNKLQSPLEDKESYCIHLGPAEPQRGLRALRFPPSPSGPGQDKWSFNVLPI